VGLVVGILRERPELRHGRLDGFAEVLAVDRDAGAAQAAEALRPERVVDLVPA
jgi:hypothetical protein